MRFSDFLIMFTLLTGTAAAQSPEEITEIAQGLYGDDVTLHAVDPALGSAERTALTRANDGAHPWEQVKIRRVRRGGATVGAVFVDNVKGKSRPITYLVAFDMKGEILGLEVLRYRESHGGEIRSPMFRGQFKGKSHKDALRVGKDIRNISGATISSRAVSRGSRALSTLMLFLMQERILK